MWFNHRRQRVKEWDGKSLSLCPTCDAPLIPKRGDWVQWHWAHHPQAHAGPLCGYAETLWHLRWKDVYMQFGWEVEVPYTVAGTRLLLDAANLRTKRVREFVHSLSATYPLKAALLQRAGLEVVWVLDGAVFRSARGHAVRGGGQRSLLKPRAYEQMHALRPLVHTYDALSGEGVFWREWRRNVWYVIEGQTSAKLLAMYQQLVQDERAQHKSAVGA